MNLSMSVFASRLSEKHRISTNILDDMMTIKGIRLLTESRTDYSSEYAYVGKAVGQSAGDVVITHKHSYIVCHDCNYEEILDELLGISEQLSDLYIQLQYAADNNEPLERLINITSKMVGNTLLVTDLDGIILAKHVNDRFTYPAQWNEFISSERSDAANMCLETIRLDDAEYKFPFEEALHIKLDGIEGDCAAKCVFSDGEPVAVIFSPETGNEYVKADLQILDIAGPLIAKANTFSSEYAYHRSTSAILESLLDGNAQSAEQVEKLVNILSSTQYILIVISDETRRDIPFNNAIRNHLNFNGVRCVVTGKDGMTVIITAKDETENLLLTLTGLLQHNRYRIGVSMPLASLYDVSTGYKQGVFALEQAAPNNVYYCSDAAFFYMKKIIREEPFIYDFIHPALSILEVYDKKHDTDLYNTLNQYIYSRCSPGLTTKRMYIHRNTLAHRLEKISEITGLNLDDLEDCTYLLVSFLVNESHYPNACGERGK